MHRFWRILPAAAVSWPMFLMATGCQRANPPSAGQSQVSPGNGGGANPNGDRKPSVDNEQRPEEKRGHVDVHVRPHDGVDVEVEREPPKPPAPETK